MGLVYRRAGKLQEAQTPLLKGLCKLSHALSPGLLFGWRFFKITDSVLLLILGQFIFFLSGFQSWNSICF